MTQAARPLIDEVSPQPGPFADTRRILIVEDDPGFRFLCASAVQANSRFTMIEADSAERALDAMANEQVDCIIADYNLPDATGAMLIEQIRDVFPEWHGPVIVITSGGSEEVAAEALRAGAADYMAKQNFNESSLCRAIENALHKSDLELEIVRKNAELVTANDTLQRRTEEIKRFYHSVSHEIKTPLTAARVFMSMLDEGLVGELTKEQHEVVTHAMECCDQITRHFNELVESTRLEAGKVRLELAAQPIEPIIKRGVISVSPAAEAKSLMIREITEPNLPEVNVDSGRIVQVIANLLGNAVKFTDTGGEICVTARRSRERSDYIELEVADSGIGISPEHLTRIFDRLYQVGEVGDPLMGAGLGLGLAISKELIELHRGTIAVESTEGEGTVFSICLPFAPGGTNSGVDTP